MPLQTASRMCDLLVLRIPISSDIICLSVCCAVRVGGWLSGLLYCDSKLTGSDRYCQTKYCPYVYVRVRVCVCVCAHAARRDVCAVL